MLDCVYVKVPGCGQILPELEKDEIPIFPSSTSFMYASECGKTFKVTRCQVPLLPAYAYTDYKSQGRSLRYAVVDIAGCRTLQSVYVMLSRVKTLEGLAILRPFPETKISMALGAEARKEFDRLEKKSTDTKEEYLMVRTNLGKRKKASEATEPSAQRQKYFQVSSRERTSVIPAVGSPWSRDNSCAYDAAFMGLFTRVVATMRE